MIKKIFISLFSIIGIIYLLLMNLDFSKMWAFGDLAASPSNNGMILDSILYSWTDESLGLPTSPFINHYILTLLSSSIFGHVLGQKILFFSVFPISFFTFYHFLNYWKVSPNRSYILIIGSLLYSFNPIIISAFVGGAIGELMTYSIFPLIIVFLHKFICRDEYNIRQISILTFLTIFILNIYVAFWYFIFIIPLLFFISKFRFKNLLKLIIILLLMLAVLLPSLFGLISVNKGMSKEQISLKSFIEWNYNDISILNLIRLSGDKGSTQGEDFLDYNRLNRYTILGYILSALSLSSIYFLIKKNRESELQILVLYSIISFMIIMGILLLIKMYPSLIDKHIIISSLRNPMKLMYVSALFFSLLFSYSINILFDKIKKARTIYIISILVVIILYNYPSIDGTLGIKKVHGEQYIIEEKYYMLTDIMKDIDKNYKDGRILFLPWEYIMNLRIRGEIPNYFGTRLGAQMIGVDILKYKEIFDMISENSDQKHILLSLFNVKYIVIDKTFESNDEYYEWYKDIKRTKKFYVRESHSAYWVMGDPIYFYSIFKEDKNFDLVYEDKNFAIFKNDIESKKFYIITDEKDDFIEYVQISDNLIKNPSFEDGLRKWNSWKNEYIKIINDSKRGNHSVILYGQDELWSTIFQTIPIKDDAIYRLNYFIKINNRTDTDVKLIWYDQTRNLGEGDGKIDFVGFKYKENLAENKWYNIDKVFYSPKDAKLVRVQFLGNRLINYANTSTIIDDVSLYEILPRIPIEPFYIIDYIRMNPTAYKIKINIDKPFILVFAESYNPSWKAVLYKNNKNIGNIGAMPIFSTINGFKIDEIGELEIEIIYKDQISYNIILAIYIMIFLSSLGYLLYDLGKIWLK